MSTPDPGKKGATPPTPGQTAQPPPPKTPGQPGQQTVPPPPPVYTPVPTLQPPKPTNGGVVQISGSEYAAWTGGKPKHDWSGLDDKALKDYTTPNQLRPVSVSSDQKAYNFRKKGREEKLAMGGDLAAFQKAVRDHLEGTGMDTIGYLPDPEEPTKMIPVIEYYAKYTVEAGRESSDKLYPKFDKYDRTNDKAATEFLLESLDPKLRDTVDEKLQDEPRNTFVVTWLQLIETFRRFSSEHYDKLKAQIKARRPSQYPAEDLETLARDFRQDARELDKASQYEHKLTLEMVKIFLMACGDSNEDFKHPIRQVKEKLTKALEDIRYKDYVEARRYMKKQKLLFTDVCTVAEKSYKDQKDTNTWPPALTVRDSKAPPSSFGASMACGEVNQMPSEAQINAMIQNQVGKALNNDVCYICKKPGHWARACPDRKNANGNGQRNGNGNGNSNGSRYNGNGRNSGRSNGRGNGRGNQGTGVTRGWKYTAPGPGEPHSKTVNGLKFEWCGGPSKCNRWTTTHNTDSHRKNAGKKEAHANLTQIEDPSVWHFSLGLTWSDVWSMVFRLLTFLSFGLSIATGWTYMDEIVEFILFARFSLLAPLLWLFILILGGTGLVFKGDDDISDNRSRRERRYYDQAHRRYSRRCNRRYTGSIRDHGLHRSYPLRLRSQGHFVRPQAPTETEREILRQLRALRQGVARVLQFTQSNGHAPERIGRGGGRPPERHGPAPPARHGPDPVNRQGRRNGANRRGRRRHRSRHAHTFGPNDSDPPGIHPTVRPVHRPTRRRRRPSPRRPPLYQPMPSCGIHGPGNLRATKSQAKAWEELLSQVNMAAADVNGNVPNGFKAALQAPARLRDAMPKHATFAVIWDSGASLSVSPDERDFVGPMTKPAIWTRLKGLAKGLVVQGQGHVLWAVLDTTGMLRLLKVPAFYVPRASTRLLSTTSVLQTYEGEKIELEADKATLSGIPTDPTRGTVIARVNPKNNLPITLAYRYDDTETAVDALSSMVTVVEQENANLSEPEKELLRWHYRLGHLGFKRIQFLMRSGVLSRSEANRKLHTAASKLTDVPKCAACQFGKQCRRPSPGKTSSVVRDKEGALKKDDLRVGQCISVDHFVCSTPGRLFSSRGKSSKEDMYDGGCIFVDHASSFVHIEFQAHLNSHETIKAKELYELMCRDHGVIPETYQSDNAKAFTSVEFSKKLSSFEQVQRFAGVGAHHHNGVAERNIQTIMSIARTMMLHAAIHWPDVADASLWPMAVSMAVFLHNHVPDPATGLAPIDLFARTRWEQSKFHDLHVWGCPVYVLDKTIADGKKLPRWKPRSRRSIAMGLSSKHSSTVPLVLNPDTGAITPAFHVVFDDWFATVSSSADTLPDFNSDEWAKMFGESTFQYPFDEKDMQELVDLQQLKEDEMDERKRKERRQLVERAMEAADPFTPLPVAPPPMSPPITSQVPQRSSPNADAASLPRESLRRESSPNESWTKSKQTMRKNDSVQRNIAHDFPTPAGSQSHSPGDTTRATPTPSPQAEPPQREKPSETPVSTADQPRRSNRLANRPPEFEIDHDIKLAAASANSNLFQDSGLPAPYVYKAARSDPDTLNFDEAMADTENRQAWMDAAAKEISALEEKGTWEEVDISDAKSKVLPGTWVFRVKRSPDGEITKRKARYCCRGDLQEGDFDTHSPTVAWPTVRVFLVLALTLNWHTCSIDFSNAFVQAVLEDPVWIHLPRGFRSSHQRKTCLRLRKSIYGLCIAPRLWAETLFAALRSEGFIASKNDPCLMMKKGMLIVIYVDDVGLAAQDPNDIDVLINNLTSRGFELTREGSFSQFLGIKFVRDEANNTITATQTGLIQKIITASGMEDCKSNWTPASTTALGIDPDGDPMEETWGYASIVGMLLYLSTNTRPDIAYAVSQVARFTHSPKKSHATAVKTIVRYLKGTADKGTIIRPTGTLQLDCWVDASFGNLYRVDPDHEPSSARSRSGWIIHFGGCPLVWKSQLQTTIALSTQEAEYVALSACMRVLIPLRRLLEEITVIIVLPMELRATIHARVFEDNNGALILANTQRITNRTRHYHISWHFFWWAVTEGFVAVLRVDTNMNGSDYMTKGLPRFPFENNRRLNQGW